MYLRILSLFLFGIQLIFSYQSLEPQLVRPISLHRVAHYFPCTRVSLLRSQAHLFAFFFLLNFYDMLIDLAKHDSDFNVKFYPKTEHIIIQIKRIIEHTNRRQDTHLPVPFMMPLWSNMQHASFPCKVTKVPGLSFMLRPVNKMMDFIKHHSQLKKNERYKSARTS